MYMGGPYIWVADHMVLSNTTSRNSKGTYTEL